MKRLLLYGMALLLFLPAKAQHTGTDSLYHKVREFGAGVPQEKVYLHMDNTCYFIGDTIWYKGYVTRSDRRTLTDLSQILYAELLTPDGYLVERQQLEMPDGTAHGAFVLKDSLYAGYYELRAYTRWILNFGQYEHPHSAWVENAFYNTQMAKDFFRDYDKLYSRVFPVYDHPEEEGHFVKEMTVRPLRRYFKGKEEKPRPNLRFYPEGGDLVEDTDCRIALELNDEDGQHIDSMDIFITDKDGREVARCRTDERGRAVFTLPDVSKEADYHAVFSYQGYDSEEKLPEVKETGCALAVAQNDTAVMATLQVQGVTRPLALHVMCQGVSHYYQPLNNTAPPDHPRIIQVSVPLDSLPTGVNQLTVFDGEGRIHADRLFFVNHHDYDAPRLAVSGIRPQYEPFDSVTLRLRLTDPADSVAGLSLAVRDRATEEPSYDNGTILTEMLLASEIKGFVENPGYYFEADDSLRRQALDRLLMVQGWRRYDWKEMAGTEEFQLKWLPEKFQTLAGSVHSTYPLYIESDLGDSAYIYPLMRTAKLAQAKEKGDIPVDFYTTETCGWSYRGMSLQHLYGHTIKPLHTETRVVASFAQYGETMDLSQPTEQQRFYMQMPKIYGPYVLTLSAGNLKEEGKDILEKRRKGFTDEEEYPDYYVKLDWFFPRFPKPYSFYQDHTASMAFGDSLSQDFLNRNLPVVNVHAPRGGLRQLVHSQPAVILDAYNAFNLAADFGLNGGKHDWRTFSQQVAVMTVGDMGADRRYFIQEQYDGKPLSLKINRGTDFKLRERDCDLTPNIDLFKPQEVKPTENIPRMDSRLQEMATDLVVLTAPRYSMPKYASRKYHLLRNLDKLYIYTDYAPREEGSWRYGQDNLPEVIIDYRRFPNEGYQHTFRDRHYVLRGYAVCEDFYSPDYSRRPLPGTKDYRRTLLWMPEVRFDCNGEATVRLYNNSKITSLSVEAEGITAGGKFIQYKNIRP